MTQRNGAYKTTIINLICGVGVLVINALISFFLSPYIVENIGVEAKGFIGLANNFVAYANLAVTALNAMAARFITIEYVKKDYKKANLYYNSVFWGNLILVAALLIPAAVLIIKLERFIDVPRNLALDIKVLFSLVFVSFFIRTGAPNYDCGTTVTNRLDLMYIPDMLTAALKVLLLVLLFSVWAPHVWYVTLVSLIITLISLSVAAHFTHKLTPELRISLESPLCSWGAIRELVGSGLWSSFANAGNTLMNGLDLLLCNLYLGAESMGVLAIAKTIPELMSEFSGTIREVFGPEMTIAYAKNDRAELLTIIQKAMKISAVVVTVPAAGIMVMSDAFYRLWMPSQDARLLSALTILALINYVFSSGIQVLNNLFATLNKVKYNTVALFITGLLSITVTFVLVKYTEYDLYAVAGVSSVIMALKNLVFMLPFTARSLGYKWHAFFPQISVSVLCVGVIVAIGMVTKRILPIYNWGAFFLACIVIGAAGLCINMFVVLNRKERETLLNYLLKKRNKEI